ILDVDELDAGHGRRPRSNQHGLDDTARFQLEHRLLGARIGGFGKEDAAGPTRGSRIQRFDERHFVESLARSASATVGCTRSLTSPPNRATSRTRLALMYVVSREGTMKTVSSLGERC